MLFRSFPINKKVPPLFAAGLFQVSREAMLRLNCRANMTEVVQTARKSATGSARKTAKALSAKKQEDLAQGCQKQGCFGVAQSDKGLLTGDLDTEEAGGTNVDPQCPGGIVHQCGIIVKQQDEELGE